MRQVRADKKALIGQGIRSLRAGELTAPDSSLLHYLPASPGVVTPV
ncbi:hypothetical protein Tco_0042051, partial [Tanacetum coccineum]